MRANQKRKKKVSEFTTPYTLRNAITKGDIATRLSIVLMGAGNIAKGQITKGILFFIVELAYLYYMIDTGIFYLSKLASLGDQAQIEIWNEKKGIYEYEAGDNSLLILLFCVITLFLTGMFILMWKTALCSAYKAQCLQKEGKRVNKFKDDIKDLFNQNLHILLMTPPIVGLLAFTVIPLLYMITMAFTSYSKVDDKLVLFDWVGLTNFIKVLNIKDAIGQTFWSVLGWTLTWAILATGLNYILGMLLAILINRKDTRFKSFWRFCFVLSIAVPQFVSLLIMRTILQPEGAVNVLLKNAGIIDHSLPFLTQAMWARVVVIVINLWVGIPYTLLQVTGILHNIPAELYESAKIDGANAVVTFFKITLPYMLFVTTPYLITQFTGNVNNFNVIFLLSGGNPTPVNSTAGKTDLLITWLYKLTMEKQYFNLGAVIGIMTFVVLAIVALVTYHNTGSYKNEEDFQ